MKLPVTAAGAVYREFVYIVSLLPRQALSAALAFGPPLQPPPLFVSTLACCSCLQLLFDRKHRCQRVNASRVELR